MSLSSSSMEVSTGSVGSEEAEITFPSESTPTPSAAAQESANTDESNNNGQDSQQSEGTCGYHPTDPNGCDRPRSCYDCLNFNVTSEPMGCMINTVGRCVSMYPKYNASMDFRNFNSSNDLQYHNETDERYYFPAASVDYCQDDDATCAECRETVFMDVMTHQTKRSLSKFCYGTNGCVCVAICESNKYDPQSSKDNCYANTMATGPEQNASQWSSMFAVIGGMVMVVAAVFAIYRIRTRGEQGSSSSSSSSSSSGSQVNRRESRAGPDAAVIITPEAGASPIPMARAVRTSGLILNLFGWNNPRDDLASKEHHDVETTTKMVSPVKGSTHVQFIDTEPSAPDIDSAHASAPFAMAVRATASAPDFDMEGPSAPPGMIDYPSAPDFDMNDLDDLDEMEMVDL